MSVEIVMPRLGWTMDEGTLVEWLKKEGETVAVGEILFIVESDKAVNEVESFDGGILHIPDGAPGPGATVAVGTMLGYLLEPGEQAPVAAPSSTPSDEPPPQPALQSPPAAAPSRGGEPDPAHSRSSAESPLLKSARVKPAISPRARRLAGELGVDWTQLSGSGRSGRITEDDVRAASTTADSASEPAAASTTTDSASEAVNGSSDEAAIERTRLSPVRRVIADRMSQSSRDNATVTLTAEIDATRMVEFRGRCPAPKPGYTDVFVRLAALALADHPVLNASLDDGHVLLHRSIHVGIAVDTDAGLLVPVIRDADRKSIEEIRDEAAALAARAREGQLRPDDLRGGTFTITNLGMHGVDAFTPIINPPQSAVLGIGRIAMRPAVRDGQVVARYTVILSLTFDHRLVDGGPAARFLAALREAVEALRP